MEELVKGTYTGSALNILVQRSGIKLPLPFT